MIIALGADHAGYVLKEKLKRFLPDEGYETLDFGTDSAQAVDYPDYILPASESQPQPSSPCDGASSSPSIREQRHDGDGRARINAVHHLPRMPFMISPA
jgi:hypothetical protein